MSTEQPTWIGEALASRRFLLTSWPWRAAAHVVAGACIVAVLIVPVALAVLPAGVALDAGPGLLTLGIGLPLSALAVTALFVLLGSPIARLELARARLVDRRVLPRVVEDGEFAARWRRRVAGRAGWTRALHAVASVALALATTVAAMMLASVAALLLAGPFIVAAGDSPIQMGDWQIDTIAGALIGVAVGLLLAVALGYIIGLAASAQVLVTRALLGNASDRLRAELLDVTRSRARLVHDFDAERRRIERDLHDGAQQRVVALTAKLGLARMDLESTLGGEHSATGDIAEAHEQAKELMASLREFVRGIHPKVLSDVGLGAALRQLAADAPIQVTVEVQLVTRPAEHVESTLYFCTAEALSNVYRHSDATVATVVLSRDNDEVILDIEDNGRGGADPDNGTGLSGMTTRVAAVGGRLALSSPAGGPTVVRMAVPVGNGSSPAGSDRS